jgi:hypothetical protein
MKNYKFAPWFPLPQPNKNWTIDCTNYDMKLERRRPDLPDDAEIHNWYSEHGSWWTLEELYKYGALPPKEV